MTFPFCIYSKQRPPHTPTWSHAYTAKSVNSNAIIVNATRLNHTYTTLLCVAFLLLCWSVSVHKRSANKEKSSGAHKKFLCSWEFKVWMWNVKCKNTHTHNFVFMLQCNCTTLRLCNFNAFQLTGFFPFCLTVSVHFEFCAYSSVVRSTF